MRSAGSGGRSDQPVVDHADHSSDGIAQYESIHKPDEASRNRDRIAGKVRPEQHEVLTDIGPSLGHQDDGGQDEPSSPQQPDGDAAGPGVDAGERGPARPSSVLVLRHDTALILTRNRSGQMASA